ncbi:hypothetical protein ANANG_G00129890 [Anguilla anguilla]|uniref:Uncharacterized protein n=1 Tax=Anguilla anguilla TaxID=7936 RepID=A0A9D3RXW8_ANGAN|nr:hypothetical protein ANANG_G00129890 [Anguilla anguilla]
MEPRFNETQPSGFIVLMPKENDHCKVQLGTTGLQRHHKETVQLEGQSTTMRRRTDQLWAPLASGS